MKENEYILSPKETRRKEDSTNVVVFLFSLADYGFYESIHHEMEQVLQQKGYSMLLCALESDDGQSKKHIQHIVDLKPEGIIYALRDFKEEYVDIIVKAKIPFVLIRKYIHAKEIFDCVYVNFAEGAYKMTRHMLEHNYKKISLFVEKASFQFVHDFCDGWKTAYREKDIPYDENWIVHTRNTTEGGYYRAREILESEEIPDAFFCASSEMALGVLYAARELNISVPDKLAVVGFTDSEIAELSFPKLTTVDQSLGQVGVLALRLLFDQIEQNSTSLPFPQEIVIQPKLRIRQSCGCPLAL